MTSNFTKRKNIFWYKIKKIGVKKQEVHNYFIIYFKN